MIYTAMLASPLGLLTLATDGDRVIGLWMEGQAHFRRGLSGDTLDGSHLEVVQKVSKWLDSYFSYGNPSPTQLPLSPAGTDYQKAVWSQLLKIPYGKTVTYGQLASIITKETGRPTSARAVGTAVGKNPISILIPCHRVVGAGGKLTGYAGGIERKELLLKLENSTNSLDR